MAAHRVTADEAFRLLVAKSQSENTKLHDVAAQFVTHASAPR
jgi:AmiR/NasT family two-component response regulator